MICVDCIGSAFNMKGAMQCPNCQKIEEGQWLYAKGSRPSPEYSMDDWAHDEDLYDLSYYETVIVKKSLNLMRIFFVICLHVLAAICLISALLSFCVTFATFNSLLDRNNLL